MRSPGGFGAAAGAAAALLLLAFPFTSAFVPSTSLAQAARASYTARAEGSNALPGVTSSSPCVRRASSRSSSPSSLKMVDQNVIMGAGVAIAGLAMGAGMVAFTEAQGERTAERGAISADRKMKMQAMFMEDDVVQTTDVDDVRTNMRRALRANQTEEELLALTADARKKAEEDADDGW